MQFKHSAADLQAGSEEAAVRRLRTAVPIGFFLPAERAFAPLNEAVEARLVEGGKQ
jgi:hypothetical protein